MQLGDKVKILECHKIPELVGQEAEVVAMVAAELGPYPIKVKLLTGEHTDKLAQFREDELEVMPGVPKAFLEM